MLVPRVYSRWARGVKVRRLHFMPAVKRLRWMRYQRLLRQWRLERDE